ncbi:MAG: hypothetical protein ACYC0V_20570, partial [Armatimonadota bacterium]
DSTNQSGTQPLGRPGCHRVRNENWSQISSGRVPISEERDSSSAQRGKETVHALQCMHSTAMTASDYPAGSASIFARRGVF